MDSTDFVQWYSNLQMATTKQASQRPVKLVLGDRLVRRGSVRREQCNRRVGYISDDVRQDLEMYTTYDVATTPTPPIQTLCYDCLQQVPGDCYKLRVEWGSGICPICQSGADLWVARDPYGPNGYMRMSPFYRACCSMPCVFEMMWNDDNLRTYHNVETWIENRIEEDSDSD